MMLAYKNTNIYYTITGQGDAILLLHGFLENSSMWQPFVTLLASKNQVICVDLLGHGKTGCLGYVHTMADMADAVNAVLQQLKIVMIDCVGHSMGGYVALALAKKQPQIFKSLCLLNATYKADTQARKAIRLRANVMAKTNYQNLVRLSFANLFTSESKMVHKTAYNKALLEALKTPVQGYISAQDGMRLREDNTSVFKTLNATKTIILGQKDNLLNTKAIVEDLKHSPIHCITFSNGHMSHIENTTELTVFFKSFFNI